MSGSPGNVLVLGVEDGGGIRLDRRGVGRGWSAGFMVDYVGCFVVAGGIWGLSNEKCGLEGYWRRRRMFLCCCCFLVTLDSVCKGDGS